MAAERFSDLPRATDNDGDTLSGALWYFYVTGTLTPASVYTTAALDVEHANPVVADAGGAFDPIYFDSTVTYRGILKTAGGTTLQDIDPINTALLGALGAVGGNTLVGGMTFAQISGIEIAEGVNAIYTSGHTTAGIGGALYVYDSTIDAAAVVADPLWKVRTSNGRGYKLAETTVNPLMFGAVGEALGGLLEPAVATNAGILSELATSTAGDLANDDTAAVQAASHYWFDTDGSTLDLSTGNWAISSTVDFVAPGESGYLQGRPSSRQLVGGHFYLLPDFTVAESVGAAAVRIHGLGLQMRGCLWVDGQFREYEDRRAMGGVEFISCNQSRFDMVKVEGTKRYGWRVKPSTETDVVTFFDGTARETSVYYSNCIGMEVGHTWVRCIGIDYASHVFDFDTYTAIYGGEDVNGAWDATPASYTSSALQRSRLTGIDTTDLRVGDAVTNRYEVAPSYFGQYTSVEADSAFYVTAGDMSTKFQVGDRISIFAGPNGGEIFTITSFADAGRRINVTPAPADTEISYPPLGSSIAESYVFYTEPTWHYVTKIRDATTCEIFPWLPAQTGATGKFWPCYGYGVDIAGNDTANMRMDSIIGYGTGTTYRCSALFAPTVGTLLAEFTTIGLVHGNGISDGSLGAVVEHCHFEGVHADVVQFTASATSSISLSGDSFSTAIADVDPFRKFFAPQVRAATDERTSARRPLTNASIRFGGRSFDWRAGASFHDTVAQPHTLEGKRHLSNFPGHDYKMMVGNAFDCEIDFAERFAGLYAQRCQAKVHWTTATGAAPSGTATFTLTARMTAAGWTFSGNSTLAAPAGPVDFTVVFHPDTKKVAICKHVGAVL